MDIYHKRHLENNQQFKDYEQTIDSIQNALRREIPHLIQEFELSVQETKDIDSFINDRATMFRFLRKNNYSLPTSLSLLLDTIRWRILADIENIRISTVENFLQEPLVYFHKIDKVNRPVLIVNLAYLPKAPVGCDVTEFLTPLVIFVLETARLLIWDITKERIEMNMKNPLVMDTVILVEFKNASSLPTDIALFKSFITLLRRYPCMTGTVNLINFGWMYQGLWQMCKIILSEEAKSKVNFPKIKDLKELIEEKDLLTDFGGKDEFNWNSSIDPYYIKYKGNNNNNNLITSRRNSNCSIYYDTMDPFTRPTSSFSVYDTPITSLTPVTSHSNLNSLVKVYSNLSLQSKLGNGISPKFRSTLKTTTTDFIAGVPSWVLSEKLNAIKDETNNNNNHNNSNNNNNDDNNNKKSWLLKLIFKFENTIRHITLKILRKMIRYKSTLYWIIACFLLRNGVQELIQHIFMLMMQLVLDFNSVRNTVGLRSLLSLTSSQMTL